VVVFVPKNSFSSQIEEEEEEDGVIFLVSNTDEEYIHDVKQSESKEP